MIRTQIYIPEKLYNKAKVIAQGENKNISQLIREGLRVSIEQAERTAIMEHNLDALVGKYEGGPGNMAATHNDIYLDL